MRKSALFAAGFNFLLNRIKPVLFPGYRARPFMIYLRITWRCNLACVHCVSRCRSSAELDIAAWKKILRDIRCAWGCMPVCFSGGEPLLYEGLPEIVAYAHGLGFLTGLNTNATLIDEKARTRLLRSGLDVIALSLESLREEVQDAIRGKGVLRKIKDTAMMLKGKIPLQLSTAVMDCNLDDLVPLADFAEENRFRVAFNGLYVRQPSGSVDSALWPHDKEKIAAVFEELAERRKKNTAIVNTEDHLLLLKRYYAKERAETGNSCRAFLNTVDINPDGSMQFCPPAGVLGDLSKQPLKEIWLSAGVKKAIEKMRLCPLDCSYLNCRYEKGWGKFLDKALKFLGK